MDAYIPAHACVYTTQHTPRFFFKGKNAFLLSASVDLEIYITLVALA